MPVTQLSRDINVVYHVLDVIQYLGKNTPIFIAGETLIKIMSINYYIPASMRVQTLYNYMNHLELKLLTFIHIETTDAYWVYNGIDVLYLLCEIGDISLCLSFTEGRFPLNLCVLRKR